MSFFFFFFGFICGLEDIILALFLGSVLCVMSLSLAAHSST